MNKLLLLTVLLSFSLLSNAVLVNDKKEKKDKPKEYVFSIVKEVKTSTVKSQGRSGTCWSYATTSFLESEILRKTNTELDLSEMFFVRYAYPTKAQNYIMRHGKSTFGEGGQAHDVMNVIANHGIMPESAYFGNRTTPEQHDHSELSSILESMLNAIIKSGQFTNRWMEAFDANLDVYLGKPDSLFDYQGEKITPVEFASKMQINASDYIEFTSYNHHEYYKPFNLEIPDNWSYDMFYNLPIDDFLKVIDNAINNDFSVVWDGDVSEKEFSHSNGVAIVPEKLWKDKTSAEKSQTCKVIETERIINQQDRQENFYAQKTTDDHLMHLIGKANDELGGKYYIIKNSWGEESNDFGGKLYMSESYVRLNTVAIMVHKDAIPTEIKSKLGL